MKTIVKDLIMIMWVSGVLMAEFSEKDIYEDVKFSKNIIIQRSIIKISKQYEKKFSKKITVKDFYESLEVFFTKVKKSDKNVDIKLLYHFLYAIKFSPNLLNEFTNKQIKDISNYIENKLKEDNFIVPLHIVIAFVDTIRLKGDINNFMLITNKLIIMNREKFLNYEQIKFGGFLIDYFKEIIRHGNTEMINISYQDFKNNYEAIILFLDWNNQWNTLTSELLMLLQLCKNNNLEIKELFLKIPDKILDEKMSPDNKKTYREHAKELGLLDFDKKGHENAIIAPL